MRAIIDADNLPHAVRYYTAFPGEPSQQLKDYIAIDRLDAVHHLTLESLLRTLDGSGEKEFLIVLHSNPNGLILPVGTGRLAAVHADMTVLNVIELASLAFGLLDDSQNQDIAVNAGFLSAWMDLFARAPECQYGYNNPSFGNCCKVCRSRPAMSTLDRRRLQGHESYERSGATRNSCTCR